MIIDRMDLDGVGSPTALAERIHELLPDLPLPVPINELCRHLDIISITELSSDGFEAALITDEHKAEGAIVHAPGRHLFRTRFSIAHELGHFLIPSHRPPANEPLGCSIENLRHAETKSKGKCQRMEAEANKFAARLLMPPKRVRLSILKSDDDLQSIVAMARQFGVSKEAMARNWVEQHSEPVAIIITRQSKIARFYRGEDFPWLACRVGESVPFGSISNETTLEVGRYSDIDDVDPDVWMDERGAEKVVALAEQVLVQRDGFTMILLLAELGEG